MSDKNKSTESRRPHPEIVAAWIGAVTLIAATLLAIIGPDLNIFKKEPTPTPIVVTEIVIQTALVEVRVPTDTPAPEILLTPDTTPTLEFSDVPMIRIPAGKFTMGRPIVSAKDERPNEGPVHEVFLEEYSIDKYEVTNGNYKECVDAGVCDAPHSLNSSARTKGYFSNPDYADFPVIHVDWFMANEYCEWRGARLPTEAEWEKAARGTNDKHFPWGQT